jgi:hypothetical protein
MGNTNLKIILLTCLILSLILVVVGIVGAVLGHILFCVPLIFGAGMAIPFVIELIPLFTPTDKDNNQDK